MALSAVLRIPSPTVNGFHLGPLFNMYIAIAATLFGIGWFVFTQRRPAPEAAAGQG